MASQVYDAPHGLDSGPVLVSLDFLHENLELWGFFLAYAPSTRMRGNHLERLTSYFSIVADPPLQVGYVHCSLSGVYFSVHHSLTHLEHADRDCLRAHALEDICGKEHHRDGLGPVYPSQHQLLVVADGEIVQMVRKYRFHR